MEEKKKSNKGLICLVVILLLAVLGLGGYILVDKDIIKLKKEETQTEKKKESKEVDEEVEIKELDLTKCLNHDGVEFANPTTDGADVGFKLTINNDKKSATLSVDWSVFRPIAQGFLHDTYGDEKDTYQITGFSKNIKDVYVGEMGQSHLGLTLFYLMDDGTVSYTRIFVKKTAADDTTYYAMNYNDNGSFDISGSFEEVSEVVKLYGVQAGVPMGGGYATVIGAKADGSFYDFSGTKNWINQ